MSRTKKSDQLSELDRLCFKVKELISTQAYVDAAEEIQQAMLAFPHSPVPHNLLGILLEKKAIITLRCDILEQLGRLNPLIYR